MCGQRQRRNVMHESDGLDDLNGGGRRAVLVCYLLHLGAPRRGDHFFEQVVGAVHRGERSDVELAEAHFGGCDELLRVLDDRSVRTTHWGTGPNLASAFAHRVDEQLHLVRDERVQANQLVFVRVVTARL